MNRTETSSRTPRAPKPGVRHTIKGGATDARALETELRKLTAQVLQDLKNPGAIPSRVIQDALVQTVRLARGQ